MSTFRDKKTRDWTLDLDVWLVEKIHKDVEGVRIDKLIANKFAGLDELFGDPVKLVRVLWVMVEEQAAKAGVSPEGFGRALGGDALEDAAKAFLLALADFIPRQQRTVVKALLARGTDLMAEQMQAALKEIAEYNPTPSTSVTTAPPSSESTPVAAG
jgi:hypothetical protein